MTISPIYGLALHTSSVQLGLCLSNFVDETRCQVWDIDRELSNQLHPLLIKFLAPQTWQDLDFIAVSKGPGSFTSIRIGIVTSRTIAQQLEIPVFTISTLAAFAWSQKDHISKTLLLAISMTATRGNLYGGIYQIKGAELITYFPDTLMTPETWQETLNNLPQAYEHIHVTSDLGKTAPSLLDLGYLDWQQGKRPHWSEALPFYGVSSVSTQ
jgi:tRNA threonylcarbamoyladenosine biosynthesis protein TsaB